MPPKEASSGIEPASGKQSDLFTQMFAEQTDTSSNMQKVGKGDTPSYSNPSSAELNDWYTDDRPSIEQLTQKAPRKNDNPIESIASTDKLRMTGTDDSPAGSAEAFASMLSNEQSPRISTNTEILDAGKTKTSIPDTIETSLTFKAGELFEDSIEVNGIRVGLLAETEIDGDTVTLKDIAIYSDQGDVPNQIGWKPMMKWAKKLKKAGAAQGLKMIKVEGFRVPNSSSANPEHEVKLKFKIEEQIKCI